MTSLFEAESFLVIDISQLTTRAVMFDVVEESYRFLGAGESISTAGFPYHNIGEGVRIALEKLEEITGRTLLGNNGQLISPKADDGSGVDEFLATLAVGDPVQVVCVGLLEDVSLESAKHLVQSAYCEVKDSISLNDKRSQAERIDVLLKARPELVVVAGGNEGGATSSMKELLETVGIACNLMHENFRPNILFVGNGALAGTVEKMLGHIAPLRIAPNIRPTNNFERLSSAEPALAEILGEIRSSQIPGLVELEEWSNGRMLPTSFSFGRIIRFLSEVHKTSKGVLGIDLRSNSATVAFARQGELSLEVHPECGVRTDQETSHQQINIDEIARWIPKPVETEMIQEYLWNKTLYPSSLPVTKTELEIEHAYVRELLYTASRKIFKHLPGDVLQYRKEIMPWVEPILVSGEVFSNSPSPSHTAMVLLDGLQPVGITTLVVDQNNLIPSLGLAASENPLLSIQVLDSSAFVNLGTVIAPLGKAKPGTPILRIRISYESGRETSLEIKQGTLELLPLPQGQSAQLHLQPLHMFDVGMGVPGRGGSLKVVGGILGVIIDARGRPLRLPKAPEQRFESLTKWLASLGG